MLPLTPTKLGRYEIVDEIGKGAMGVVYLARDPLIGRLVALKTFRIGFSVKDAELDQFRARFIREAQSAGILSHPNIVTIHDVVERSDEGLAFIAMEYVRGTNLKSVLQEDRRPPLPYVTAVIAQVADALDYAHSCKVIHRDVKPANILITADDRVKITDFGIARLDTSNLTQEGQLLGTPNYMSPEQILGRDIDARADIFSLGVVLYEMLTRHKPFQGENLTVVSHRIVYDHFTPPREYVDDLPPGTETILNKALEKDPGRRYQRARDLAEDLRRVLGEVSPRDLLNETQSLSSTAVLPAERLAGLIASAPTLVTAAPELPADEARPAVPRAAASPPLLPMGGPARGSAPGAAGAGGGVPGRAAGAAEGGRGGAAGSAAAGAAGGRVSERESRRPFFWRLIRGAGRTAGPGNATASAGARVAAGASAGAVAPGGAAAPAYPHATRPTPKPALAAVTAAAPVAPAAPGASVATPPAAVPPGAPPVAGSAAAAASAGASSGTPAWGAAARAPGPAWTPGGSDSSASGAPAAAAPASLGGWRGRETGASGMQAPAAGGPGTGVPAIGGYWDGSSATGASGIGEPSVGVPPTGASGIGGRGVGAATGAPASEGPGVAHPLPAAPLPTGAHPGPFSTSMRRALLLGAAALVLAVAAGWGLVSWARQQNPRGRVSIDTGADANRHNVLRLMQEGRRLLDSGDPRGAAAAYREAEQLAPEQAASLRKRRADAERQAFERDRRLAVENGINSKLAEARAELAGRRYAEADAAAAAVLAMSPGNTAAEEVRTAAQAALQRRKERLAAPAQAGKQAAPRPQDAAAAQQAAAARPAAPPPAAAEAAGDATLELAFFSELPEGTVMLYVNDRQVLHQSYDFREKGGLGGLFRTKSRSDWVRKSFQVPAGSAKIRLYVTPQGRAAQVRTLSGNFAGGTTRHLDAKLASSGELDCSLNPPS
jgi:tRNA A-37 threonylcarbamoyl transferase component Bud32